MKAPVIGEDAFEGSSAFWAAVNLSKLCIGSGVLALPYATSRGGLLLTPLGIALVGIWNYVACVMMINCKKACVGVQYPRGVSSTFSKLAYSACGWWGVGVTDASIIFTLIGVCISYEITFSQLMKDIPFLNPFFALPEPSQVICLTYLCGVLSYPLSCVRNVAFLSPVSLGALICLLVGIVAIIMFGQREDWSSSDEIVTPLRLWPEDASHLTTFVGIAIFCFGLCTAAFPVEESMSHRDQFTKALRWCVIFVCSVYAVVGVVIALLYSRHPDGIKGNILQNLPLNSATAAVVRTCLSVVCVLSFPLALVPPAQMIEQLILQSKLQVSFGGSAYQRIATSSPPMITDDEDEFQEPPAALRAACRLGLVTLCTVLAANVPCFGLVVSLLGCFTVSILSFVLPPLLHLMLVTIPESQHYALNLSQTFIVTRHIVSDSLLLALGVITFVCATGITAMEAFNSTANGDGSC